MSFSNLVSDIAFRDARVDDGSSQISHARSHRSHATARSYTSTAATSVSIAGEVSSQLHYVPHNIKGGPLSIACRPAML